MPDQLPARCLGRHPYGDIITDYEQFRRQLHERFKLITASIEVPEDRNAAVVLDPVP